MIILTFILFLTRLFSLFLYDLRDITCKDKAIFVKTPVH